MSKIYLTLVFISILCNISCNKSERIQIEEESNNKIFTQKKWKVVSIWITTETESYDSYKSADTCLKDDWTTFDIDSSVVLFNGSAKCNKNEPSSIKVANWFFSNDNKIFNYKSIANNVTTRFDVIQFEPNLFVIEAKDEVPGLKMTRQIKYIPLP